MDKSGGHEKLKKGYEYQQDEYGFSWELTVTWRDVPKILRDLEATCTGFERQLTVGARAKPSECSTEICTCYLVPSLLSEKSDW
jgi:hypothetical protein